MHDVRARLASGKTMRILLATVDYPPIEGGIATVARELARALAAAGHEVTVVAPGFPDMDAFDAAEPVRVLRFPGYERGWLRLLPFLRVAWPEVQETDLILAINIGYGGVLARLARARYGTRYLTFGYAYEFLKFRGAFPVAAIYRNIYRNAMRTIAISQYTATNLRAFGLPADQIATVLPGAPDAVAIDPEEIAALRAEYDAVDAPLILAVGRFIARKGHLTLVEALPEVLEHHPRARLVLIGRGPQREACIEKAKALSIESQVFCPGYLDDDAVRALYAACDLFALPAGEDAGGQVEGFGLVYAEAGAYGKPAIAGDAGGAPDAVHHEQTGLLVPPADPHALAKAIIRLLDHPAEAQALGDAGKQRVETELNWAVFAAKVMEVAQ